MNIISRLKSKIKSRLIFEMNKESFEADFLRILPDGMREPASYLFYNNASREEKDVSNFIETFRKTICSMNNKSIATYSSPRSNTFNINHKGHAITGPLLEDSIEANAKTGVNKSEGILLRKIIQGLNAKSILELGTNTGLSGCYFLSCPNVKKLITIEGSKGMCEIAEHNLKRISDNYRILNLLFDDAIDLMNQENISFDCIYIDGQHEREASWHYTKKVIPLLVKGGAIIFDDIYWSDDMNQFWREIIFSSEFSKTFDFRSKGIGIVRSDEESKMHYDICDYVGRQNIFRKVW